MLPLMDYEPFRTNVGRRLPFQQRLCKEVFSGCGLLSRCWSAAGLSVGSPVEAYPKKNVYVSDSDLSDPNFVDKLDAEILMGIFGMYILRYLARLGELLRG